MKSLNLTLSTLFSGILAISQITFDSKVFASELNSTNVVCSGDAKDILGQIPYKYCTSSEAQSGVTFEDEKQTRNSDRSIKYEFKAFNRLSAAATVEVYDSNKNLVDVQIIDGYRPPIGLSQSFGGLLFTIPQLQSKYPPSDFRRILKEQNISVTIPAGGYVTITKSSNIAIWYNSIKIAFDTALFSQDVAQLGKEFRSDFTEASTAKKFILGFAKEVGNQSIANIFTGSPTIQSAYSQDFLNKNVLAEVLVKFLKYSTAIEPDLSKNPISAAFIDIANETVDIGLTKALATISTGLALIVKVTTAAEGALYIQAQAINLANAIANGQKVTVTLTDSVKVAQPEPPFPLIGGVTTYVGIWKGEGLQDNGSRWSILITLIRGKGDSVIGTMEYPSLTCGGQLTLRRVNTQSIELAENLTYGKGRCVNRGTVTLQPISSNRLQYKWYYSDGKLGATGTVQKVAQSEPPKSTNISRRSNDSRVAIQSGAKSVNWMDANAISSNTVTRFVGRAEVVFSDGNKRTFYNNAFAVWGLGGIVIDDERLVIIPDNSNICVLQNPEALRYLSSYRAYTNIELI